MFRFDIKSKPLRPRKFSKIELQIDGSVSQFTYRSRKGPTWPSTIQLSVQPIVRAPTDNQSQIRLPVLFTSLKRERITNAIYGWLFAAGNQLSIACHNYFWASTIFFNYFQGGTGDWIRASRTEGLSFGCLPIASHRHGARGRICAFRTKILSLGCLRCITRAMSTKWCRRQDLHLQHLVPKTSASSLGYFGKSFSFTPYVLTAKCRCYSVTIGTQNFKIMEPEVAIIPVNVIHCNRYRRTKPSRQAAFFTFAIF